MIRPRFAGVLALTTVLAACVSIAESADAETWGSEPVRYFTELSRVYTESDHYGVLDFYAPGAEVEKWRGAVEGGLPVSALLIANSGDLGHELEAVYIGDEAALTLVFRPRQGDQEAIVSTIDAGLVTHEVVFDLAASLARSLRASPDVISIYDDLYAAYAAAWSSEDPRGRTPLYAADAVLRDALAGLEVSGREAIADTASPGVLTPVASTTHSGVEASAEGQSVYLGPRDYAQDPGRAVGVYDVKGPDGCVRRVAVQWTLTAGVITEEQRFSEVESFRRCSAGDLPEGWWTDLMLPEPSDQVVTGVIRTGAGQAIAIHNGTPRLDAFVQYGLDRFSAAGLDEPVLDTVTFEPSRRCVDRSGRVLSDESSRDLFLCMYESELCPGGGECMKPRLNARIAILHELGHVWLLGRIGDETQEELLEIAGLRTWDSLDVPWEERGVEYAAEVLAWGLVDEATSMVRFGSPPCEDLTAAYRLLTGTDPLPPTTNCG